MKEPLPLLDSMNAQLNIILNIPYWGSEMMNYATNEKIGIAINEINENLRILADAINDLSSRLTDKIYDLDNRVSEIETEL